MLGRSPFDSPLGLPVPAYAEFARPTDMRALPASATFLRILGVNYVHLKTAEDGDLYVTEHGLPYLQHLLPQNWYESEWFQRKRERLQGTSSVYRVPTKPVPNHLTPSLELVVKWSRVGEDVPLNTYTFSQAINAEFNSPFEEFSLVEEMRTGIHDPHTIRIHTQKPLAIYVPPERLQLWQTGRSRDRILRKIARHASVEIDILRSYILIYGWIKGMDAVEAYRRCVYDERRQQEELVKMMGFVNEELRRRGFLVADNKPTHVIVRLDPEAMQIRRRRDGQIAYALVDYELLARTPEREEAVRAQSRSRYLLLQRDRFKPREPVKFPSHLQPGKVLGVDYIYGRAESTNGLLWVVGKDPELFNYFLPERWRFKQIQLSRSNRTFYTQTKDRIHLVWRVSRVGDMPPGFLGDPAYKPILLQGYNSPFEEFALALEIASKGVRTTYPRAIYVTGQPSGAPLDLRRFQKMKDALSPEGQPVLRVEPDYITVWGYWRGLEDDHAPDETGYWTPIDVRQARAKGIITDEDVQEILARQQIDLERIGFEDVSLRPDHILISYIPGGGIKRDDHNRIELRHCNFEMVRRL